MTLALWILGGWFVLFVLVNLKRGRPDGTPVAKLHPYRRMMPFIMPGRNESIVYFDRYVPAEALLRFLEAKREALGCDVTHCLVAAAAQGLEEHPALNRFVSGRRLYQRRGRFITFSMKRKQRDKESKLATVKLEAKPGESFRELCTRINAQISHERSDEKTYLDRELSLFGLIPGPVLALAVRLFRWLDAHNLLPGGFIAGDGMFTSIFIANLGSLGMGPAYHHLFEWGNCPVFLMAGRIEDRPVVLDGVIQAQKVLHLRYSYDERIDDGLTARHAMDAVDRVLTEPFAHLAG